MKIKSDFVTNSSSTSYLILVNDKDMIYEDTFLFSLLGELINFKILKNIDDLIELGYEKEEIEENDNFKDIIKHFENDGKLFHFKVPYSFYDVDVENVIYKHQAKILFGG